MHKKHIDKIQSESFIRELIKTFEDYAHIALYWSPFTGCSVGEAFKKNYSSFGNMFELVFLKTCERNKIPCKIISQHNADFLIDDTCFEMKTCREHPKSGIVFTGTGTNSIQYNKCGNYILIGYTIHEDKVLHNRIRLRNRGLFRSVFYSVNQGIIHNEHWKNNSKKGRSLSLHIPIELQEIFDKDVSMGHADSKKKYVKMTCEPL